MGELNFFCFLMNVGITVLSALLITIIPILTRKSLLFGVKVPELAQKHSDAKALRKRYVTVCVCGMLFVLALCIFQYIWFPDMTLLAVCYFPLLLVPVQMIAYIPCWKKALILKKKNNWKALETSFSEAGASSSRGNLSLVKWSYYIVAFLLVFLSMAVVLYKYPALPDPFPTHFDIHMNPDAWAEKSLLTVLTLPLINLAITAFLTGLAVTIVMTKLQINPENPGLSFAQHREYRKRMGHGMGILTAGLSVSMIFASTLSIWPEWNIPFSLVLSLMLLPVLPLVVIGIRCGQSGCKLKPKITAADTLAAGYAPEETEPYASYKSDDSNWIVGMFYYNPEDSSILIEDRFGTNIGFNYAHIGVKLGVGIVAISLIALYVWMTPLLLSLS